MSQMSLMLVFSMSVVAFEGVTPFNPWTAPSDQHYSSYHQLISQATTRRHNKPSDVGLLETVTALEDQDQDEVVKFRSRKKRDSDASDFRELERNRIAQIRNRQRNKVQIHRSEKSLSRRVDNDFGSFIDENDDDSKKSKRIGKVVIKLRNGKKLVVKKRRKLNNNEVNTTTQKPVLVTVKSNFKQKSRKNNGNSFGSFNTVSARPPQKLDIGKDPEINVFSLDQKLRESSRPPVTPPPISFITTPAVPSRNRDLPAIIVTPRSEQGIRSSSQIFESNKVIEPVKDIDDQEEFDYYNYYDDYEDDAFDGESFRSQAAAAAVPSSQPSVKFSSSTFPPPEERFAEIDQNDLNNFSNFPAQPSSPAQSQSEEGLGVNLSQLRQELLQTQFGSSPTRGAKVTIGLKSNNGGQAVPTLPSPTLPVQTPNAQIQDQQRTSVNSFSSNIRQQPRFGLKNTAPGSSIPNNFDVKTAVPPAPVTVSSRDRFQTAFTTTPSPSSRLQTSTSSSRFQTAFSTTPAPVTFPSTTATQFSSFQSTGSPLSARGQVNNLFSTNLPSSSSQQNLKNQENLQRSPAPVTPVLVNVQNVQTSQNRDNQFESNSVIPNRNRLEQARTLNIFDNNKVRTENSFDQSEQLLSTLVTKQSKIGVKNPLFPQQKQQSFSKAQQNNPSRNRFNSFKFESLPKQFSSLQKQQSNAEKFFFGPPSQTINMRDGSYTIITLLR